MDIISLLDKDKKIIIYGAGKNARLFYTYLGIHGLEHRVSYFVVTEKGNNPDRICGKPVFVWKEIKNIEKDSIFFLIIYQRDASRTVQLLYDMGVQDCHFIPGECFEGVLSEIEKYCMDLPLENKKIFFDCYGGKTGYACNCKYIANEILDRELAYKMIWNMHLPNQEFFPREIEVVETFSKEYFEAFYTSGIYIENTHFQKHFHKRNGQIWIGTWHGTGPFKKVNASAGYMTNEQLLYLKNLYKNVDLFVSNSDDNTFMFRESFLYDGEILEQGNPRNDIFFYNIEKKEQICRTVREKYNIAENKKIVLYAPTFREKGRTFEYYDLVPEKLLNILSKRFGCEFVMLYKLHHILSRENRIIELFQCGINVADYLDTQELLVAADVLITDYSSIMWDFSLQRKPVFLYMRDEEEYTDYRGFYWPISEWPYVKSYSMDDLCNKIENFKEEDYLHNLEVFFEKDHSFDKGDASKKVVDRILELCQKSQ